MAWDRIEGNWKQFMGLAKEKWGNLTDDDLTAINGRRDQLDLVGGAYSYVGREPCLVAPVNVDAMHLCGCRFQGLAL